MNELPTNCFLFKLISDVNHVKKILMNVKDIMYNPTKYY